MAHRPYTFLKREKIYYVRFRDPDTGRRMTARSTQQTSKAAAENWALDQAKRGLSGTKSRMTFAQYAEDWWLWVPTSSGRSPGA